MPATRVPAGEPIPYFCILAQSCIFNEMSQNPLEAVQAARDAYEWGAWADAAELFLNADAQSELGVDDLEALV